MKSFLSTQYKVYQGGENMANNSSNQLVVPGAEQALEQMKTEIASEFGVQLGADSTSRSNGSVGGEITKRLVQMAEQQYAGYSNQYNLKMMDKDYSLH